MSYLYDKYLNKLADSVWEADHPVLNHRPGGILEVGGGDRRKRDQAAS